MNRRFQDDRLLLFILTLAVFLLYARGLEGPFLYDDRYYVVDNPTVKSLPLALATLGQPTALDSGKFTLETYRPLVPVVYAAVHAVGGMRPLGFHLLNVLLHCLNGLLLFRLLRTLVADRGAVFWATAWWALHPVHVEAVQWISGLDDVLGLTLALAALLLWQRGKPWWALAAYVPAVLVKETGLMAVGMIFVLAWRRGEGVLSARLRHALRALAPFAAVGLSYGLLRLALIGPNVIQGHWGGGALDVRMLTMAKAFLIYLRLIVLPVQLRINYLFAVETGFTPPVMLGLIALLALAAVTAWSAWRRPILAVGILWFFIFLFPGANIIPIQTFINERLLYAPLAGVALLLADLGAGPAARRPTRRLAWIVPLCLAVLTFFRVGVWLNEETLLRDIVAKEPEIVGYQKALGDYYLVQNRFADAETAFRAVLERQPESIGTRRNLAAARAGQGRLAEAEDLLATALREHPSDIETAALLAKILLDEKKFVAARELYRQLTDARPQDEAYRQGLIAAQSGSAALSLPDK